MRGRSGSPNSELSTPRSPKERVWCAGNDGRRPLWREPLGVCDYRDSARDERGRV
jgi:hypothetical protein